MGKSTALLFIWHIRTPGSAALQPRPCAACAARALRPPGALRRGRATLQITISDRVVAGLLIFKKLYMTATQQNQKNASQTDENVSACLVPQAHPRARVCGLAASTLRRLRGARPCGRRARSAADCLPSKIPCLTARLRACFFSKFLVWPPGRGLASFQNCIS